ncbi:MAG: MBL fold metallo-hydrolase [Halobacteriaceae archaeon]
MTVTNLTADAERFTCNAYLAVGAVPALVDAGTVPGVVDEARRVLAETPGPDDLDRVVVTHQHADHVEQLEAVVEAFDPAVYAHDAHPLRTHALDDGDEVAVGDATCEVVHTPGHADDHVALVSGRDLFSGDVVVYEDGAFSGGSFGRTDRPGQSRERLVGSLETLLERMPADVDAMYPGHGPTYEGDVRAVVERALERAARREPKYDE